MAWCLIKHRVPIHGAVLGQVQVQLYFSPGPCSRRNRFGPKVVSPNKISVDTEIRNPTSNLEDEPNGQTEARPPHYAFTSCTSFTDSIRLICSIHSEVSLSLTIKCTKSFRTGRLERELQMVQLSATRCSSIAIL
jgi:hypothetical protein